MLTSDQFYLPPTRLSTNGMSHPAFTPGGGVNLTEEEVIEVGRDVSETEKLVYYEVDEETHGVTDNVYHYML